MKNARQIRPRVSMTLDDDVLEGLEEIAERDTGRSVSEVGRIIVTEAIRSGHLTGLTVTEVWSLFTRVAVERRPRVLDRRGLVVVPRLD